VVVQKRKRRHLSLSVSLSLSLSLFSIFSTPCCLLLLDSLAVVAARHVLCREKKKFTWDWHAWNLALVSTPSVLLAYFLHGVGKRMYEEAAIREEIQERTGVSSRGFLIPKREVREEVLGMLSAGNQPGAATGGEDVEKEVWQRNACPVFDNLVGVVKIGKLGNVFDRRGGRCPFSRVTSTSPPPTEVFLTFFAIL